VPRVTLRARVNPFEVWVPGQELPEGSLGRITSRVRPLCACWHSSASLPDWVGACTAVARSHGSTLNRRRDEVSRAVHVGGRDVVSVYQF